jgi:LysM repeat protein
MSLAPELPPPTAIRHLNGATSILVQARQPRSGSPAGRGGGAAWVPTARRPGGSSSTSTQPAAGPDHAAPERSASSRLPQRRPKRHTSRRVSAAPGCPRQPGRRNGPGESVAHVGAAPAPGRPEVGERLLAHGAQEPRLLLGPPPRPPAIATAPARQATAPARQTTATVPTPVRLATAPARQTTATVPTPVRLATAPARQTTATVPTPVRLATAPARQTTATVPTPVRLTRLGRALLGLAAVLLGLAVAVTAATMAVRHGRPVPALPASAPAVVVVKPGDTLWEIARRVAPRRDPRDVVAELRRLNALPSADVRAGQQLRLRGP